MIYRHAREEQINCSSHTGEDYDEQERKLHSGYQIWHVLVDLSLSLPYVLKAPKHSNTKLPWIPLSFWLEMGLERAGYSPPFFFLSSFFTFLVMEVQDAVD